jgi:uncharacterized protein (TIGR02001 family)
MKKSLLALVALLSAAGLCAQEESTSTKSYAVTADVTFVSKYVFRGFWQQDNSLQPSLELSAGGFTAGVWAAQALKDRASAWANGTEIDFYGSYEFALPNDFALTVGLTSYQYPKNRPSLGEVGNTLEGSIGVSGAVGPVSLGATYFHDWDLDSDTFEFGAAFGSEINRTVSYEAAAAYGVVSYKAGGDYDYYTLGLTFGFKLNDTFTLSTGVHWSDTDIKGLDSNTWFSVGVSAGF